MRQLLFMYGSIALAVIGGMIDPVLAIIPYYVFSILQPQSLWAWALPGGTRWSFIVGGIGLLFATLHLPSRFERIRFNPVIILLIIFGLLVGLSCLTAHNPRIAEQWLTTVGKILLMAVVIGVLIETWTHILILLGAAFASLVYLAWHYNSLYYFEGRLDILFYGHGVYDNNGAGLLVALVVPMAYALLAGCRVWPVRIAAAGVGLIGCHALMLSYSRGAMVAGMAGLTWLAMHHRPRWQLIIAAPVVVSAILLLAGPEVRREFDSIGSYQSDDSAQSRLTSWYAAWQIAWDHPLTGVGLRNSNLFSFNYGADIRGRTIHNQYLQTAADVGIPALLVYLGLLAAAVRGTYSSRQALRRAEAALGPALQRDGSQIDGAIETRSRLRFYRHVTLAVEASVITFAAGAMFLSLETFEVAYMLLVIAGAMPVATTRLLEKQNETPALATAAGGSLPALA